MLLLMLAGCQGPDAPDPALCRDYIHRVCIAPVCAQVVSLFPVGASCEATLQANAGCQNDDFVFTTPTRAKFLNCRLPLLRASENVEAHPACEDVAEAFTSCPDVVRMLQGIK
jgi:hypothetical protein